MKAVLLCILTAAYIIRSDGLRCVTCYSSKSIDDCDASGKLKQCMSNENSCETTVRRSRNHITVMKGCKASRSCRDNQMQNTRYSGGSTQCNSDQDNSVCTCCCNKDMCNIGIPNCNSNYPQAQNDAIDCPAMSTKFPHGNVKRHNDKVYEFQCTEKDYFVWPEGNDINICLGNGSWAHEKPCCARNCPPYRIADQTMLVHHTGESGKRLMQQLPTSIVYAPIGEDALKLSVMSYGDDIVESSVVKFNEYGENATRLSELLRERQVISEEGPGNTGRAMQYALDNLITLESGMRPNKIVLKSLGLHTNTQPNSNAIEAGKRARERGILVYVFGFEIGGFKFDRERLAEITGTKDHLFIFQGYYGDLTPENIEDHNSHFCPHPCDHSLHDE